MGKYACICLRIFENKNSKGYENTIGVNKCCFLKLAKNKLDPFHKYFSFKGSRKHPGLIPMLVELDEGNNLYVDVVNKKPLSFNVKSEYFYSNNVPDYLMINYVELDDYVAKSYLKYLEDDINKQYYNDALDEMFILFQNSIDIFIDDLAATHDGYTEAYVDRNYRILRKENNRK